MSETRLLPANITLLQPGSRGYRLSDALTVASMTQQVANATTGAQIAALQADVTALQGYVTALQGQVSTLQGQVSTLQGQVSTLQGQVTTLQGQVAAQQITINSFNYQQIEVSTGTIFLDQRTIYKRTFVINGALNNTFTNFVFAHGIQNINYIVNVEAMAAQAGGQQLPITFVNLVTSPNITIGLSCWTDTVNIIISVGATAFAGYQVLATLWYTAIDR